MSDRLFPLDDVPEIPLFPEPRQRKGPARGSSLDARFQNDYPPEWHLCPDCGGQPTTSAAAPCLRCLGMGSVKARVRREADHRCERCLHPYVPKGDAAMLGVEPSWREGGWSACDESCSHRGPLRVLLDGEWSIFTDTPSTAAEWIADSEVAIAVQAQWRILTVHHLDGDKANLAWWNLAALCQRCHLQIQAKVVMERVYPHEHTDWFKPHAAGYYAYVYLGQQISRQEAWAHMDELLALERAA